MVMEKQKATRAKKVKGELFVVIEQQHHGKANGCGQKAVDGVEHGVPVGDVDIEGVDLAQNLRRENEAENGDFQRRRQLDSQPHLHPAWDVQQSDGQHAEKRALIVVQKNLAHQRDDDHHPQCVKDDKGAFVLSKLLCHGLLKGFFQPAAFLFHFLQSFLRSGSCLFFVVS